MAFHLDRLVEAGLATVTYERRNGRTGPGAGRPAKIYHRSAGTVAASVPERHYELAAALFAQAITAATAGGLGVDAALAVAAKDYGRALGEAARSHARGRPSRSAGLAAALVVLGEAGFEPEARDGSIVLRNCPFDALVRTNRDLVCGMNRVADGRRDRRPAPHGDRRQLRAPRRGVLRGLAPGLAVREQPLLERPHRVALDGVGVVPAADVERAVRRRAGAARRPPTSGRPRSGRHGRPRPARSPVPRTPRCRRGGRARPAGARRRVPPPGRAAGVSAPGCGGNASGGSERERQHVGRPGHAHVRRVQARQLGVVGQDQPDRGGTGRPGRVQRRAIARASRAAGTGTATPSRISRSTRHGAR